jgi:glutathione S-transferase
MRLQVSGSPVRYWRGIHLLHSDISPSSQKVRILLSEKNIAWKSHELDLRKQQHTTPWFLAINPRGVVPVLVHNGDVHIESNEILEYVDSLPSDRVPFFPRRSDERSFVMEELAFQASLRFGTRALTIEFMPPQARFLTRGEALNDYRKNGIPDLSRDMEIAWWRKTAELGVSHERLVESYETHRDALRRLENRLRDHEWAYGTRISVLDIAWFTMVHQLKILGYALKQHPHLLSWYQRLLQRPAFQQVLQIKGPLKIMFPAYRLYRRMTGPRLEDLVAG